MKLVQFQTTLADHPDKEIVFRFPSGESIAPNFHVTEIGKVVKDFVDCGGTRRSLASCRLQTWVADDLDHRLQAEKLAKILGKAESLGLTEELTVQVEVQLETIGIFDIADSVVESNRLVFQLAGTKTACLAPELCGLEVLPGSDCDQPGCC